MKKVVTVVSTSFKGVQANWPAYLQSMLLLQVIRTVIMLPILSYLFYKMLAKAQLQGLTNENFSALLNSPAALLFGLLLLLLLVYFIFYELGYYFLVATNQVKDNSSHFFTIFRQLNHKARFFLSLHSFLLVGYFLLILPIVSIGLAPELTEKIKIPDFIVDELLMTGRGQLLYGVVILVMSYLALRFSHAIYFFVIEEEMSIGQAFRKSWQFSKGRTLTNFFVLVLLAALYGLLIGGMVLVLFVPLLISERFVPIFAPIVAGVTITLIQVFLFLFGGLIQPLIANGIIAMSNGELITLTPKARKSMEGRRWLNKHPKLSVLVGISLLGLVGLNIWSAVTVVYQGQTSVIAHRGFMEQGVENTIGSLKAAVKTQADYVEMDIQETRDQQFVVMHDYNLKRLAGVNKEVRNLTLKELEALTVKQRGFSDKIPSLADYIEVAKAEKIKLLIEVKPHGYESAAMEANLVKLLEEKKVSKEFLVQSLDLTVLDNLKALAPSIQTGYIIPLTIGSLPKSQHDFYVLEEFSVTKNLLAEAGEQDKQVFVWTVNKDELLKKYLRLDVAGLITNHPDRAIELRGNREDTRSFFHRVQYLLE